METSRTDAHRKTSTRGALADLSFLLQAAFPTLTEIAAPVLRRRYQAFALTYEAEVITGPHYAAALRTALGRCDITPRWVGDVAAGTGAAAREILDRFPRSRVIAVDLSHAMLKHLHPTHVLRAVGNIRALPLRSDMLDLVVSQNAPLTFSEVARIVRPGGTVVYSLTSGGPTPAILRRWLIRRALPPTLALVDEIVSGGGVAWIFRKAP